ncbi:MAG TPA: RNA polymerase sigma factor SigF [Actinomycetota bacterium]
MAEECHRFDPPGVAEPDAQDEWEADLDTELDESTEDEAADDQDDSQELFERLADDPSARDELIHRHYPLAEYLARRFRGRGEPLEDLTQVASIGLIKAIDRFDPGRDVKFSTYATATIVGEIKRHFRDKGWALRVPRRLQEVAMHVGRALGDLSQELGRSPTVPEIAERIGLTEEEVLEGMEASHAYSAVSLDAPVGEDDEPTGLRTLGAEDESIELLEGWASVAPALRALPARERRILYLRFFRGLTQTQIAQDLGISQMHVSRLLARALTSLRQEVVE